MALKEHSLRKKYCEDADTFHQDQFLTQKLAKSMEFKPLFYNHLGYNHLVQTQSFRLALQLMERHRNSYRTTCRTGFSYLKLDEGVPLVVSN